MKKILFSLVALMIASVSYAQDMKIFKAEELMEEGSKETPNNEEKFKEAVAVIKECLANPKTKKKALAYHLLGEINARMVNAEIEKLHSGACDTALFIQATDDAIEAFLKSNEIDKTPDSKGRVKVKYLNKFENSSLVKYSGNKERIKGMLQYYSYCAGFKNARKDQQGALEYFKKAMDLPKSAVFTPEESQKIYKKDKKFYNRIGYYTAMLYYEKKDWDNVLKYVDFAIADSSSLRDGYVMKMGAFLEKGDTAKWVETVKQAIHDMPNNVANCQNLLKYYDDHKMSKEAEEMANELITKSPNNRISWYTRGCVYMNTLKKYAEARADFKKALEIDPKFYFAQFNLGCTYVNELMSIKDQLVQDRSNVKKYNEDMAKARGYYRKALPYFENTMVLAPDKIALWGYNLQTVYYNLQDGAQKEEMVKREAEVKKIIEGQLTPEEFIANHNIQITTPTE
jgi:tetratricopeptide (TPR) repeat protein